MEIFDTFNAINAIACTYKLVLTFPLQFGGSLICVLHKPNQLLEAIFDKTNGEHSP